MSGHHDEGGQWARNVESLRVGDGREGSAVDGRRLSGPIQGFGKMWQKTYRVELTGVALGPAEVIEAWKADYNRFWPAGNEFAGSAAGIAPGEVGLIEGRLPGGPRVTTGVLVMYADDVSWAFMTPEGHPFAGMITFSAEDGAGGPVAQIQLLIRAHDPLVELAMPLFGHRQEDRLWEATLANLATHLGVDDPTPTRTVVCVDGRRQWDRFSNITRSRILAAMLRPFGSRSAASRRTARQARDRAS